MYSLRYTARFTNTVTHSLRWNQNHL